MTFQVLQIFKQNPGLSGMGTLILKSGQQSTLVIIILVKGYRYSVFFQTTVIPFYKNGVIGFGKLLTILVSC